MDKHWDMIIEKHNEVFCIICHYIMERDNLSKEDYRSMCMSNNWNIVITINKRVSRIRGKK